MEGCKREEERRKGRGVARDFPNLEMLLSVVEESVCVVELTVSFFFSCRPMFFVVVVVVIQAYVFISLVTYLFIYSLAPFTGNVCGEMANPKKNMLKSSQFLLLLFCRFSVFFLFFPYI